MLEGARFIAMDAFFDDKAERDASVLAKEKEMEFARLYSRRVGEGCRKYFPPDFGVSYWIVARKGLGGVIAAVTAGGFR